jgi:predicted MarR family transcription regulator
VRNLEKLHNIDYSIKKKKKNWVGIIIDKSIKEEVVKVRRIGNSMMLIKLSLGEETINKVLMLLQ